ncbi:MAG: DNA-deoxyinosine glycosylase [Synergistaceae bacterium]|jgi:TDG/mug DNA glycosylase family protein|nr:DNA-deoxyinosine glycosylase [Synergistaceae bacterium]
MRIHSFAPIVGREPRVLILGSMPSAASLALGRYYGNERNHFWRLMSAVLDEPERADYAERTATLERRRVALWDAVCSCVRPGSLDADIRDEAPNDVNGLITASPTIRAVFFNGKAAERLYFKYNESLPGLSYFPLPSSSPVPRRDVRTFEDRLARWMELRRFL